MAWQAYREALKEYIRECVPLDWAMTQNNLGTALQALGARESGTQTLEEAMAAYQAALSVFETAQAPYYIGVVEHGLQRAQQLLEQRKSKH